MSDSITHWLDNISSEQMCYAILSAVSELEPIRHYISLDGRNQLHPLYANTPYAQWHAVMPYLVRLSPKSRFWQWIEAAKANDWGWVFSTELSERQLVPYFTALTQVVMPNDEIAFFRYWDTDYLRSIFHFHSQQTNTLLPPITSCWLNHETFDFHADLNQPAKQSPWFHVSDDLIQQLEQTDHTPIVNNLMLFVQENRADLWLGFPHSILKNKAEYFVTYFQGNRDQMADDFCQQLADELSL